MPARSRRSGDVDDAWSQPMNRSPQAAASTARRERGERGERSPTTACLLTESTLLNLTTTSDADQSRILRVGNASDSLIVQTEKYTVNGFQATLLADV